LHSAFEAHFGLSATDISCRVNITDNIVLTSRRMLSAEHRLRVASLSILMLLPDINTTAHTLAWTEDLLSESVR
jgi:hypothetical protein